jgi:cysteine desulfurase
LILLWRAPINSWTKGVGFAYIRKNSGLQPLFLVEQEKGLRAGTEAAPNCGYGKSIELSYANLEVEQNHTELKLFDHPTQN